MELPELARPSEPIVEPISKQEPIATTSTAPSALLGNDSPIPITIPIDVVRQDSVLYKMLHNDLTINIKKDARGHILVDAPRKELEILASYLLTGEIEITNVEVLLKLLDYFNIFTLKAEYPQEYLAMKVKEEWYRNNLYNPYFTSTAPDAIKKEADLDNPKWGLTRLKHHPSRFKLAEQLHLVYAKHIYSKRAKHDDVHDLVERNAAIKRPSRARKHEHAHLLRHAYDRPAVLLKNAGDIARVKAMIASANAAFKERDAEFGDKLLRESMRFRGQDTRNKVPLRLDYCLNNCNFDYSFPNNRMRFTDRVIQCLRDAQLFKNVCLAGGKVLNRIIDCRISTDYDLFIHSLAPKDREEDEEANDIVLRIIKAFVSNIGIKSISRSEHAMTIKCLDYHYDDGHHIHGPEVQIIFRLYRNISEVIHGFDVDCCCVCYDGESFWATQRALYSITHLVNFVDFDRMSPSYETRLSKYNARGFSIFIPDFDKSRVKVERIKKAILSPPNRYGGYNAMALNGIDILLYHYYTMIAPYYCKVKSDYALYMSARSWFRFHREDRNRFAIRAKLDSSGTAIVAYQLTCTPDVTMIPELALDLLGVIDAKSVHQHLIENASSFGKHKEFFKEIRVNNGRGPGVPVRQDEDDDDEDDENDEFDVEIPADDDAAVAPHGMPPLPPELMMPPPLQNLMHPGLVLAPGLGQGPVQGQGMPPQLVIPQALQNLLQGPGPGPGQALGLPPGLPPGLLPGLQQALPGMQLHALPPHLQGMQIQGLPPGIQFVPLPQGGYGVAVPVPVQGHPAVPADVAGMYPGFQPGLPPGFPPGLFNPHPGLGGMHPINPINRQDDNGPVVLKDFVFKVPITIVWKKIKPGGQATSTFHQLVVDDISLWYKGLFYRML